MGADRVLIEGQLRMKQAEYALDAAKYKGIQSVFNALSDVASQRKKVQNKDYSEVTKRILDNNSALTQKDYDQAYNKVSGENYDMFVDGDEMDKGKARMNINKWSDSNKQYDDIVSPFCEQYDNGEISNAIAHDPAGIALLEYIDLNGPSKLHTKECPEGEEDCDHKDEEGVLFPDFETMKATEDELNNTNEAIANLEAIYESEGIVGDGVELDQLYEKKQVLEAANNEKPTKWKSLQWLQQTTDYWKKDKSTAKVIQTYGDQAAKAGLTNNPDDKIPFPEQKYRNLLDGKIFGGETPGKLHSMIYDEMIDGRVFRNDFIDMIQGGTYSSLGITDEQLAGADMNADGIIDKEEATLIGDTVLKDQEAAKGYLKEYLMTHFRTNFNNGSAANRKPALDVVDKRKEREDIIPQTRNTEYL